MCVPLYRQLHVFLSSDKYTVVDLKMEGLCEKNLSDLWKMMENVADLQGGIGTSDRHKKIDGADNQVRL